MKKVLLSLSLIIAAGSAMMAQTKAVETFDYAVGAANSLGSTADGWGGAWTLSGAGVSDSALIEQGSIQSSVITTTGNKLALHSLTAAGSEMSRTLASTWTDVAGAEYWISYLFEVKNAPAVNDSWQGFSLDNSGEQAYIGKLWGTDKIGINDPDPYLNVPSTYSYADGAVWMVARIVMSGDADVDTAYLWLNPSVDKKPSAESALVKADITLNNGFNAIRLHLGMSAGITASFDEVRLGTSWNDVVPSSSSKVKTVENVSDVKVFVSNNNIKFNYKLAAAQNVKLDIVNMEGKIVKSANTSDLNSISLSRSGLSKGIYVYRLTSGQNTASGKLCLF